MNDSTADASIPAGPIAALRHRMPGLGLIVAALVVGCGIPFYVDAMGDGVGRLLLLPLALVLAIAFLVDKFLLLNAILLIRSAGDVFFETTKVAVGGMSIGLGGLINIAVLVIVALLIVEGRRREVFEGQRWWVAFVAVFAAGVVYAPNPGEAVRALIAVLSYFAVFLAAYFHVARTGDISACVRLVLLSSMLPVLQAVPEMVSGLGALSEFRLKSSFTHPNIFAFYLVTVAALLLYALKSSTFTVAGRFRGLLWVYLGLVLVLLLLTKTRSAWVACFAIFFIYALKFERRYLVYLCIAPFLALLIPSVQERLIDLTTGNEVVQYGKLNSFAWRQLIWKDGLQWMEPVRYLAGYGVGGFAHHAPTFFSMAGGVNFGAHNVFVQLFFDSGLAGLGAFVALLLTIAAGLRRLSARDRLASVVLLALVVQYAIVSLSDNMMSYLAYNWYVFFILGAGVAASRIGPAQRVGAREPGPAEGSNA